MPGDMRAAKNSFEMLSIGTVGQPRQGDAPRVPLPTKPDDTEKPKDLIQDAYTTWKLKPDNNNLAAVVHTLHPTLSSAVNSYAGGNQALMAQAKRLAAGAIQTYDPNRGAKLTSHVMTQLQPLQRLHRERSAVTRVPERVSIDLYKLKQEQQRFQDTYGREAADSELSAALGMPSSRIRHLRTFNKTEKGESQLTTVGEEGEENYYPGVNNVNPEQVWMEYVHHDLDPVSQKILEWKTGYNGKDILPNQEIAKRLKLSPGAVSQRSAAIAKRMAEFHDDVGGVI